MADLSAHPHAKEGEAKVAEAVDVRIAIYWMQTPVTDYDDKTSMATVVLIVRCTWVDPRLAGRPEEEPLPQAGQLWPVQPYSRPGLCGARS